MWPFKKKQTPSVNLPSEMQDYYQTTRREKVGVAWLLALGTMLVTVLLAVGLFYGGRWTYRQVFHKNNNSTISQQGSTDDKAANADNKSTSDSSTTANTPSTSTPSTSTQGTVAAPTQANNPASVPTQPTQTTTPSGKLANTGPGDTLALFVSISLLSYFVRIVYLQRKTSDITKPAS